MRKGRFLFIVPGFVPVWCYFRVRNFSGVVAWLGETLAYAIFILSWPSRRPASQWSSPLANWPGQGLYLTRHSPAGVALSFPPLIMVYCYAQLKRYPLLCLFLFALLLPGVAGAQAPAGQAPAWAG